MEKSNILESVVYIDVYYLELYDYFFMYTYRAMSLKYSADKLV